MRAKDNDLLHTCLLLDCRAARPSQHRKQNPPPIDIQRLEATPTEWIAHPAQQAMHAYLEESLEITGLTFPLVGQVGDARGKGLPLRIIQVDAHQRSGTIARLP